MMETLTVQKARIPGWLPTMNPNGSRQLHWSQLRKRHDIDRDTAWAAARQAGWTFVPGKVRLTITLVFPNHRRRDIDNLTARCKGIIDGLKCHDHPQAGNGSRGGFFEDDSTEWLELDVRAEVVPRVRETRLELQEA